jgi:hypothetical protein
MKPIKFNKLHIIYLLFLVTFVVALTLSWQLSLCNKELRRVKEQCRKAEYEAIGAKIGCVGSLIHLEHVLDNKKSIDSNIIAHVRANIKTLGRSFLDSYFDPVDLDALAVMEGMNEGAVSTTDVIRIVKEGELRWRQE